jgi:hypothetical protein
MTSSTTPPQKTPEELTVEAAKRLRTWLDVPSRTTGGVGAAIPPDDALAGEWGAAFMDLDGNPYDFRVPDDPLYATTSRFDTVGVRQAAPGQGPQPAATSKGSSKPPSGQSGA